MKPQRWREEIEREGTRATPPQTASPQCIEDEKINSRHHEK